MDLRRLGLFLAVVDEGGMTRAAASRHVSQPSVSQAIRELEAEVGTPLFHRVGRGLVLTAAGEVLVGPARQTLRDVDTARAAVDAVAGLTGGHLDLGALPTLAVDPLATLVGRFRVAHPDVSIRLADPGDSDELAALVGSGACELGLTVGSGERERAAGLEIVALGRQDLLAVLPPGTRVPGRTIGLARLAEFPLVAAPAGTATRLQFEEAFAGVGTSPHVAVTAAQREAILPLVLAGAGATLFPRPLAEQGAALGAVVVPVTPRLSREVVLVHRPGPLSPAAGAFVALARS